MFFQGKTIGDMCVLFHFICHRYFSYSLMTTIIVVVSGYKVGLRCINAAKTIPVPVPSHLKNDHFKPVFKQLRWNSIEWFSVFRFSIVIFGIDKFHRFCGGNSVFCCICRVFSTDWICRRMPNELYSPVSCMYEFNIYIVQMNATFGSLFIFDAIFIFFPYYVKYNMCKYIFIIYCF